MFCQSGHYNQHSFCGCARIPAVHQTTQSNFHPAWISHPCSLPCLLRQAEQKKIPSGRQPCGEQAEVQRNQSRRQKAESWAVAHAVGNFIDIHLRKGSVHPSYNRTSRELSHVQWGPTFISPPIYHSQLFVQNRQRMQDTFRDWMIHMGLHATK